MDEQNKDLETSGKPRTKATKPILLAFVLIILAALAGAGFMFFSNYSLTAETRLPRYKGDAITNIGNDPFIEKIPLDYIERYKAELLGLKNKLADNPDDVEGWLKVGLIKKLFNNYEGARDAWEYAKVVNPRHSTAYYNLGDLYSGYIRDLPKAEENYLKAIEIDPTLTQYYLALAQFYTFFYKEKSDNVDDVLIRGLEQLPTDIHLRDQLIRYYKEQGYEDADIANALKEIFENIGRVETIEPAAE